MHQSERDCPERKVPKKKKREREANAGQAPTTSVGQRWGGGGCEVCVAGAHPRDGDSCVSPWGSGQTR